MQKEQMPFGPDPDQVRTGHLDLVPGRRIAGRPLLLDVPGGGRQDGIKAENILTVFPNFHPWGSFNPIVYRFRPNGSNPDECIHECMFFAPAPDGEKRPPAAPIHWLGPDDDWVEAPELGMLAKVFNQDVYNVPRVQAGLKTMKNPQVIFADYGETKPRHFHELLETWIQRP